MKSVFGEIISVLDAGAAGVALEVLLPDGSVAVEKRAKVNSPIGASLLRAEAQLLNQYRRVRGVIRFLAFRETAEGPVLLMEKAEGGSLRDWLNTNGSASARQAHGLLQTVLEPLAVMHSKGHIHRDIKPENLLVKNGKVCLADFGFAHGEPKSVGTFPAAGTPGYLAPEVVATGNGTTASDIFSLSVVAREMLLGRHPGDLRDLQSVLPDHVARLVYWMSSPTPTDRPTARRALTVLRREKMLAPIPGAEIHPGWVLAGIAGLGLLGYALARR